MFPIPPSKYVFPTVLAASTLLAAASPLAERLKARHNAFLDTRRELFGILTDPFQTASKAKVIEEVPEAWTIEASPWRRGITATVFWVGEKPTPRNPTPNNASAWDPNWERSFGGYDDPSNRNGYLPAGFLPNQTPFYIALPYNDVAPGGIHRPEANEVVPWFWKSYRGPGTSVCHGRWVAIHRKGRICYARWKDVGPFTTDDWLYVFKGHDPQPNANKNAGIDVSPAIRDYLGMNGNNLVDWKFIEDYEVPDGPWKNWHPAAQTP